MRKLGKDIRVTLTSDVDLHPYATLKAGERGTVRWADYDDEGLCQLELRMDTQHYGLSLYDNCAILVGDDALALTTCEEITLEKAA